MIHIDPSLVPATHQATILHERIHGPITEAATCRLPGSTPTAAVRTPRQRPECQGPRARKTQKTLAGHMRVKGQLLRHAQSGFITELYGVPFLRQV